MWPSSSRLIPRHPTTVRVQEDPNVAQIQSTDPETSHNCTGPGGS